MDSKNLLLEVEDKAKQMLRATVLAVHDYELVAVGCEREKAEKILCDVLQTSKGDSLVLAVGDTVLVWLPEDEQERGVVLGRIGPSRAPAVEPEKTKEAPDELVIEAKKNLTLKCGEGSITLRKDGKILIKGKDLVSQAKHMNRIKGGSVAIN